MPLRCTLGERASSWAIWSWTVDDCSIYIPTLVKTWSYFLLQVFLICVYVSGRACCETRGPYNWIQDVRVCGRWLYTPSYLTNLVFTDPGQTQTLYIAKADCKHLTNSTSQTLTLHVYTATACFYACKPPSCCPLKSVFTQGSVVTCTSRQSTGKIGHLMYTSELRLDKAELTLPSFQLSSYKK